MDPPGTYKQISTTVLVKTSRNERQQLSFGRRGGCVSSPFTILLICVLFSVAIVITTSTIFQEHWQQTSRSMDELTTLPTKRRMNLESKKTKLLNGLKMFPSLEDNTFEQNAINLVSISLRLHNLDTTPWLELWNVTKGRILQPICVSRPKSEAEELSFLTRNSIFEQIGDKLCTVTNGFEFAIRRRLDVVQHPRETDMSDHPDVDSITNPTNTFAGTWNTTVAASQRLPSCRYAGSLPVVHKTGWGDQWYDTAMHLAEGVFVFNQPTVMLKPFANQYGPQVYTYRPNNTQWCPADDWSCFVFPLSSCKELDENNRGMWRAPWFYYWNKKYVPEAEVEVPGYFKTFNHVLSDLGGGNNPIKGMRGLMMIVRQWATRPLPWLRREVDELLTEQGLTDRLGNITNSGRDCATIHLRRSDVKLHGRPVYSLKETLDATLADPNPNTLADPNPNIVVLSDTEIENEIQNITNESGFDPSWIMLDRYRGKSNRCYSCHFATKNITQEVIYLYAELELASSCSSLTYQQGAFAGVIWDQMCRRHGGWGVCFENTKKVAMCDMCCNKKNLAEGVFNVSTQSCWGRDFLPQYACATIFHC